MSPFRLEALAKGHGRAAFSCGEDALDRYLKTQASQDVARNLAACFVAVEVATGEVAGFYTIAAASILVDELPEQITKKLPRYPMLPAVRIGRLGIGLGFQKRGLGGALLADATRRCLQSPPAIFALLVDAKNEAAVSFYEHHGFCRLVTQERTLFLTLKTAEKALLG